MAAWDWSCCRSRFRTVAVGAVPGSAAARLERVGFEIRQLADGYSWGDLMVLGLVRKRTRCLTPGERGERRESISLKNKAYRNSELESEDFRIPVFSLEPNGFSCSFLPEAQRFFCVESKTYGAIKLLCRRKNPIQMARRRATCTSNRGDTGARIILPLSVHVIHVINANAAWCYTQGMGGVAFFIGTRTLFAHISCLPNLIPKHGSRPQNGKSLRYLRESTCSGVFKGGWSVAPGGRGERRWGNLLFKYFAVWMWRRNKLGFPCFLQSLTAFRV